MVRLKQEYFFIINTRPITILFKSNIILPQFYIIEYNRIGCYKIYLGLNTLPDMYNN